MPSPVKKNIVIPTITKDQLEAFPKWAQLEYKKSQEKLTQLKIHIVKLESNIADLETMAQKQECPRSLRVKVQVQVSTSQQQAMDASLHAAKKSFEQTILQSLINARKAELSEQKGQAARKLDEFITFYQRNLETLQNNNIEAYEDEEDLRRTIQLAKHKYELHTSNVETEVRTQHFFNKQRQMEIQQKRQAEEAERRINEELQDSTVKKLLERMDSLEKSIRSKKRLPRKQLSRPPPRRPKKSNVGTKRNQQTGKQHPFRPVPGRKIITPPPNRYKSRKGRQRNQGQGNGNQGRWPRYTNTTNRSGSRPPGFRPRRN